MNSECVSSRSHKLKYLDLAKTLLLMTRMFLCLIFLILQELLVLKILGKKKDSDLCWETQQDWNKNREGHYIETFNNC